MYHGHFAAALFIKALCGPSIPSWPILFGSSLLDIIGGMDIILGLDVARPNLEAGPYMYTDFVSIDWEHSVAMMLLWSCTFGWVACHYLAGFKLDACLIGAASSVVHWLMDVLVISEVLSLYPHSDYRFGLGLYEKWGTWAWVMECGLSAILGYFAWRTSKSYNSDISSACALLAVLSLAMSPWTSPLLVVAHLDAAGYLGTALPAIQAVGFWIAYIVPATIFSGILDKEDKKAMQVKGI